MASKFKKEKKKLSDKDKKDIKKKLTKVTMDQVIEDAKNMYPVSQSDVKKLEEAASSTGGSNNIKIIKDLKKRYDKIKKD